MPVMCGLMFGVGIMCIASHLHPFIVVGSSVVIVDRFESNHTCTSSRFRKISFLKVGIKCSRIGVKVGVRPRYHIRRPSAKFRRNRSSFDAPTVNRVAAFCQLNIGRFGV